MLIQIDDDFDMDRIADSGQCFRWERQDPRDPAEDPAAWSPRGSGGSACRIIAGAECLYVTDSGGGSTYRIIAGTECLYVTDLGGGSYDLDCTPEKYDDFWKNYFDLEEDYRAIRGRIDPDTDPFLREAADHEKGIRILRQDPWEMLITFIISQNRNIPAIRRSVEMLSAACGESKTDSRGREYYAFPMPAALRNLSEEELSACRLGYRGRYVHAAAEAVCAGEIDLGRLLHADEENTMAALTALFGVGVKVASCVSLFGLHHTDAFPVDVWMKRILADHYPAGYPFEKYAPYNGVYQQYMFAWYRHRD